jgi:hypothetical protein
LVILKNINKYKWKRNIYATLDNITLFIYKILIAKSFYNI